MHSGLPSPMASLLQSETRSDTSTAENGVLYNATSFYRYITVYFNSRLFQPFCLERSIRPHFFNDYVLNAVANNSVMQQDRQLSETN